MKKKRQRNLLAPEHRNGRGAVSHVHQHHRHASVEIAHAIDVVGVEEELSDVLRHEKDVRDMLHVQRHLKTAEVRLGEVQGELEVSGKRRDHGYDRSVALLIDMLRHFRNIAVTIGGLFEGKVDLVLDDQAKRRFRIHLKGLTVKLHIVEGTVLALHLQIRLQVLLLFLFVDIRNETIGSDDFLV